jgi:anti-anti-sigma factor
MEIHALAKTRIMPVGISLDCANAKRLARWMDKSVCDGVMDCIIDMSAVQTLDSAGLAVFVAAVRRLAQAGGWAIVVSQHAAVRAVFEIAGLTRILSVVDRIEKATVVAGVLQDAMAS